MQYEKRRSTTFGMMLKQLREAKGISVDRMAYEVGTDVQAIEHIEANRRPMPPMLWSPWGDALHIPPSQLVAHYLICEARKICLEGNLPYFFKMTVEENTLNDDMMAQAARLSKDPEERPWHGK